ncbi:acyltransferase family protein [Novosphingobium sp. M1R2S20]|uniref:Acyltransferase family protein n=1 Tax=Novosphingobium rhizovicinum TaxID=3228928 RepID=A0ABV3RI84_9SPHN
MSKLQGERQHFWDGLRALLMLLGIPYHVALTYRPGKDFIVHSGEGVWGFAEVSQVIHLFRMPAFFLVAGYFASHLLRRRDPGEWLKGRYTRLGIPFLTCIVTLVPAMNLACELSNMPWPQAIASWRHNSLTSGGYWVRHLWFIIVLLYFCTAAAAWAAWSSRTGPAAELRVENCWSSRHFVVAASAVLFGVAAWESLALEAFYVAGLATMVPQQILRLDEVIIYAPWFILGFVVARSPASLVRICRFSAAVAALAVLATVTWLSVHDQVSPMAERFIGTIAAAAITQVFIATARRFLDRPMPLVRRLTDASFVIYLLHLPLITLFVWLAQPLNLPTEVKAVGVMGLSLGVSYLFWLGTRRLPRAAPLFDGIMPPASSRLVQSRT